MTSEERREARYQRRKAKREESRLKRSVECGSFDEVFSFRHLYLAGKKCAKGVNWKNSTQRYIGNLIPNTARTWRELQNRTFKHRGFYEFNLFERGKKRHIRSVHISERVVQKALCDYCIVPIYSKALIYDNAASLKDRGMDFALRRIKTLLQKHYRKYGLEGGILLYDFHSYFDTASHVPLFREAAKRIHDPRLQEISNSFIEDFGECGLGLGSQVSQVNALLLPNAIDHFFKEQLGVKVYARYMDDGIAIHHDLDHLYFCYDCLLLLAQSIGVEINMRKTRVIPLRDFFRFLKTRFIVTATGKVVLKMNPRSTTTVRRKYRSFKQMVDRGEMEYADIRAVHDSYRGYMMRGNSFRIVQNTNHYFKNVFGFYPDKKGWSKVCIESQRTAQFSQP